MLQTDTRIEAMARAGSYYQGRHDPQLRVKFGKYDDNLVTNLCALIVDRSISDMVGSGVTFTHDDEATLEWLQSVWDANRQEITLHKSALAACLAGTGYIKIVPDGVIGADGAALPRTVPLDPTWLSIDTAPEDAELIRSYTMQYNYEEDGRTKGRKEVTARVGDTDRWEVITYEDATGTGKWMEMERKLWGYQFPPIIHWQNLPTLEVYGEPDLTEDILELQDRYNGVSSNVSKIIRYHAHPKTIITGMSGNTQIAVDPDKATTLPAGADAKNLEMQSDLTSSMAYLRELRQSMFDISRTVDIDSIQDKVGNLTNFGLRVLYHDALQKIDTKRELFGDMLLELNRRMLIIGGKGDDPGGVEFSDMLPPNEIEETAALKFDIEMGLCSKETASIKRGYDWEEEQEKIAADKQSTDNIGLEIIRQFNRGQGMTPPQGTNNGVAPTANPAPTI
jgi:hypothetical protein